MRLPLLALLIVGTLPAQLPAQVARFPYQAIIEANDVDVRSGPGRKYYPTNKLKQGDRVIVHRHDPGGQYMIAPPAGSFSWIPVEAVKQLSDRVGVLTQPNVSVRIGSTITDEHDIEQVRLSTGDQVEILGTAQITTNRGPVSMYKIKSPAGEWRWVSGQFVTPLDPTVRRQQDHDPFAIPSQAKSSMRAQHEEAVKAKAKAEAERKARLAQQADDLADGAAVIQTSADDEEHDAERDALKNLDDHFRQMVDAEPDQWKLDELAVGYQQLHDNAGTKSFASLVRTRLQAVERYRKIQNQYVDFIQLTSETDRREAEYLAQLDQHSEFEQADVQLLAPEPESFETVETVIESDESGPILSFEEQGEWQTVPAASGPELILQQSHTEEVSEDHGGWVPATQGPPHSVEHAAFETAENPHHAHHHHSHGPHHAAAPETVGVVHRSRMRHRGAPQHVLVGPHGHVIAFLQARRGINLDRFVGRPVDVQGQRMRRPDLRSDFIVVHGIRPVQMVH